MYKFILTFALCLSASLTAFEYSSDDLYVRVVDVGAGECCVIKLPGDKYIVYDAGNYEDRGVTAFDAVSDIVPHGSEIEYLILSHTDSDHLGAVPQICEDYKIRNILHAGLKRTATTWKEAMAAINDEKKNDKAKEIKLKSKKLKPGTQLFEHNDAKVSFVCGFAQPPAEWGIDEKKDSSEFHNAGSIIIRIEFAGKSILLTGDAVGRHIGDPDDTCIAEEAFMVENQHQAPIDSDVIVAPHHGADNGSSIPFIRAVSPEYVVFSAGHKYSHPRAATVKRFIDCGIAESKIFRTDRGDNEGVKEWKGTSGQKVRDSRGDDDVNIRVKPNGNLSVEYRD